MVGSYKVSFIGLLTMTVLIIGFSSVEYFVFGYSIKEVYFNPYPDPSESSAIQSSILQVSNNRNVPNNDNDSNSGSEYTVNILDNAGMPGVINIFFNPPTLHVKVGDTVNWINQDSVGHSVNAMAFDSGLIWPSGSNMGPSTYSHTFTTPGTYNYFCAFHPYMSGAVYVNVQETQRTLISSIQNDTIVDAKIEIPLGAAYEPNFGPMFIPAAAHIPLGSQITWTNQDYVPHTATSTEGFFDTGIINPGDSKSTILNERYGTIGYYCKIHPWMQGMIVVNGLS